MKIYGIKATKIAKDNFERLISELSPAKEAKIGRFRRYEDSLKTLIAEVLARYSICLELGIKNSDITFTLNEFGKPFIKGHTGLFFNISHSADWVICGLSKSIIGVDVEKIRPVNLDIAQRFFSPSEHEELMKKNEEDRVSFFYDLWTLKESYIKADGRGMSLPLDSFSITFINDGIKVITENELRDCNFLQYKIDQDYKFSVCSISSRFPDRLLLMDFIDLYEGFLSCC